MEGLEWTDIITNAKIRTSGSSKAILSATHVKKIWYVYQVNVGIFYCMLKENFDDSGHRDFDEWIVIHGKNFTLFQILVRITRAEMSYVCA